MDEPGGHSRPRPSVVLMDLTLRGSTARVLLVAAGLVLALGACAPGSPGAPSAHETTDVGGGKASLSIVDAQGNVVEEKDFTPEQRQRAQWAQDRMAQASGAPGEGFADGPGVAAGGAITFQLRDGSTALVPDGPPTAPVVPADLARDDDAGAAATAAHVFESLTYGLATGDVAALREYMAPSCEACQEIIAAADAHTNLPYETRGGQTVAIVSAVRAVQSAPQVTTVREVDLTVEIEPVFHLLDGMPTAGEPASVIAVTAVLQYDGTRWLLFGWESR